MDLEPVASILLPPGHNAGDLVESYKWEIINEAPGKLEVKAHLPERLLKSSRSTVWWFSWRLCRSHVHLHCTNCAQ